LRRFIAPNGMPTSEDPSQAGDPSLAEPRSGRDADGAVLLAAILDLARAISESTDLDTVYSAFCEGLSRPLGCESVLVAQVDLGAQIARVVAARSREDSQRAFPTIRVEAIGDAANRLWHGEVLAVADTAATPLPGLQQLCAGAQSGALAIAPVLCGGDWHAMLIAGDRRPRPAWSAEELALLRAAAEQLGAAILQRSLLADVMRAQHDWELTFDTMSEGVLLFGSSQRVYRVNAAAAAMLRMARSDVVGMSCCQLLTNSSRLCPVHVALERGTRSMVQETPVRIGRSSLVTVDPINGQGGAVVVIRDVSELRQAQAHARRQGVILSEVMRTSTDLMAMLDTEGRHAWANPAYTDALQRSSAALRGTRLLDYVAESSRAAAAAEIGAALRGTPGFLETRLLSADGDEIFALVTLTPVLDEDDLAGVLVVGRDMTDQMRAAARAAEADKLRALGQLSSGVAHNFNNALSVILGRTQLLLRRIEDPGLRRDLETVERVSLEASQTVRRIQNFARRRAQESFEAVDLATLLFDTVELTATRWREQANARGVTYDVSLQVGEEDYTVLGDGSELREVFVNLIFNALDAMPSGGALSISLHREGPFVVSRVTDAGAGMSEAVQRRLFEPFFTTKEANGTGLGLAVSYSIVSRHDGRLEFETEVGKGTTFIVALPHSTTHASATLAGQQPPAERVKNSASVLVVDDDRTVREVIAEALAERGFTVSQAASAGEALRTLVSAPVDLVIADLSMPDINGAALAAAVRRDWEQTRVVLMSAADVDLVGLRRRLDADWSLRKPFEIDELCSVVDRLTAGRGRVSPP
jgi:PAS domain S-box-containing protein